MSFTDLSDFTNRLNHFLYRQSIRKLGDDDIQLARDWTMNFIRREHPALSDEQVERFYDNLLHVQISVVDEWSQRMR